MTSQIPFKIRKKLDTNLYIKREMIKKLVCPEISDKDIEKCVEQVDYKIISVKINDTPDTIIIEDNIYEVPLPDADPEALTFDSFTINNVKYDFTSDDVVDAFTYITWYGLFNFNNIKHLFYIPLKGWDFYVDDIFDYIDPDDYEYIGRMNIYFINEQCELFECIHQKFKDDPSFQKAYLYDEI